jgi:hypothetical protein
MLERYQRRVVETERATLRTAMTASKSAFLQLLAEAHATKPFTEDLSWRDVRQRLGDDVRLRTLAAHLEQDPDMALEVALYLARLAPILLLWLFLLALLCTSVLCVLRSLSAILSSLFPTGRWRQERRPARHDL